MNKEKKRLIFQNMEFLLTGFSPKKEKEIEVLIRKYGGIILYQLPSINLKEKKSSRSKSRALPIVLCLKLYACFIRAEPGVEGGRPIPLRKCSEYPSDMSNQLNLCVNAPANFHADNVTYLGKNHVPPFVLQNRCGGDFETIPSQRKIKFNLNNGFDDEPDRKNGILNLNPVSTGLRLSYDVDERNSSISSASGSFMPASSIFSALGNDINREIDQQNKELDLFIRIQSDNTAPQTRHFKETTHRNSRKTNNRDATNKLNGRNTNLLANNASPQTRNIEEATHH
ncbi:hypothetical protein CASFOL_025872 [Castilleja foliolosa]|uniref:BRCT domain-containing protein n=1 Tax=Castilleja foliolosa TaxID=1961234 RepID=A0ABD3CSC5_9LAMI